MLEALKKTGDLEPIDYWMSHFLTDSKEPPALSLAYAFKAARLGHTAIQLNPLSPSPQELGIGLDETRIKEEFISKKGPLIFEGDFAFIPYLYKLEKKLVHLYLEIENRPSAFFIPSEQIQKALFEKSFTLSEEQEKGVMAPFQRALTLITGGPGTGKTYTAACFISLFCRFFKKRIALAAPTGKAAANLHRGISLLLSSQEQEGIQVKTLHALLQSQHSLDFDLVLVDEASMVDLEMMVRLLEALKPGSSLVLMGDPDQLPSVEAGSVFKNLTALSSHTLSFTRSKRVETEDLLQLASYVQTGDIESFLSLMEKSVSLEIRPLEPSLIQELAGSFSESIKILTPLRKGPYGSEAINLALYHFFYAKRASFFPIMIAQNDYELELFNGDCGILSQDHKAFFPARKEQESFFQKELNQRVIPQALLPTYEWGYALSVHKSQGSESEKIILVLPPGSETLGREMLYTALTRAKKEIVIYGDQETLTKTLEASQKRVSALSLFLRHYREGV